MIHLRRKLRKDMFSVTNDVRYIGVDDHDIDLFESQYIVPNGISYNSYIIFDEKICVMDTVDKRKCGEYMANLEAALEGKTPDYSTATCNHAEEVINVQPVDPRIDTLAYKGYRASDSKRDTEHCL